MKEGGFNLRKWKSSSKELSERINTCEKIDEITTEATETKRSLRPQENVGMSQDNQTYVKSTIGPQVPDDSKSKIFGLNWDVETDSLYYELNEIQRYARMLPPTKRTVLKLVAKIFDPLGHLSAFTVKLKIMFQSLCKIKTDWDDELRGEMRVLYDSLMTEGPDTRCNFSGNLQRNSTLGRCKIGKYKFPSQVTIYFEHIKHALLIYIS